MSRTEDPVIIEAATVEAQRMLAAADRLGPDTDVRLPASQFVQLARLLAATADAAERRGSSFGAPIDGIRFWVPLPEVEAQRAELAALRAAHTRVVDRPMF